MPVYCRNCRGSDIKIITRKRYLIIAGLYVTAAVTILIIRLSSHLLSRLAQSLLTVLVIVAAIACLRCILYAAMQITPSYKCRGCGYYFWRKNAD